MKLKFKHVDIGFLIFLVLATQTIIPLKFLGFALAIIVNYKNLFNAKVHRLPLFYLSLIGYSIISGLLFYKSSLSYLIAIAIVILFWSFSLIFILQTIEFVKKNRLQKIHGTLEVYFIINVSVIALQFLFICLEYNTLNPFLATPAAGDYFKGIFDNSSVNMIIMSFFLMYWIYKGKYSYGLYAAIGIFLTSYMSGIVLFLSAIAVVIFISGRVSAKMKLYLSAAFIGMIGLYYYFSIDNFNYAYSYISRSLRFDENTPYKIISFYQTFIFLTNDLIQFIFGAGPAGFSSRVAFLVSGDYVSWYPESLIHQSEVFKKFHLGIWNFDFNNKFDNINSTANQPFSVYNQIAGEYGLIGLTFFIMLYLWYWVKRFHQLSYGKILLISLLGYFLLDYWFEYFSVVLIFELLMLADLKKFHQNISY